MLLTKSISTTELGRLGLRTPLGSKAQALLRSAARAQPLTSAATPATLTQGATWANSTIVSGLAPSPQSSSASAAGQIIAWNDPRLVDIGGVWGPVPSHADYGFVTTHISNVPDLTSPSPTPGAGKMFGFDGQAFEVGVIGGPVRVAAKDLTTGLRQRYSGDYAVTADYSGHFVKVDFRSRAPRIVEIYFAISTTTASWAACSVLPPPIRYGRRRRRMM